jgi:phage tail protein X
MAEATQYIVREGERWDTVAYKAYGRASLFHEIILANPLVPITPRITGGTVLNIPVIDEVTVQTDKEKLPPWKQ